MELLRTLMQLQSERGCLTNDTLRELSRQKRIPLYRLEGLASYYPHFRRSEPKPIRIQVCRDVVCRMARDKSLRPGLEAAAKRNPDIVMEDVSCIGCCDAAPAFMVNDSAVDRDALRQIADEPDDISGHLALCRTTSKRATESTASAHVRRRCDPASLPEVDTWKPVRDWIAACNDLPSETIQRLKASGLRGMGGAGFPTGRKWELVAAEDRTPKFVICNADESEPGTFKDRGILTELPYLVVQGMVLAGLTIGAEQGIVYLRHEYEDAHRTLETWITNARRSGFLGDNVCGTGHAFDIEVFISPGGYILGEETALLEALEDKRGEPRNKPPYPGVRTGYGDNRHSSTTSKRSPWQLPSFTSGRNGGTIRVRESAPV